MATTGITGWDTFLATMGLATFSGMEDIILGIMAGMAGPDTAAGIMGEAISGVTAAMADTAGTAEAAFTSPDIRGVGIDCRVN